MVTRLLPALAGMSMLLGFGVAAAESPAPALEVALTPSKTHFNYVAVRAGTVSGGGYDNRYNLSSIVQANGTAEDGTSFDVVWGSKNGPLRYEIGLEHRSQDLTTTFTQLFPPPPRSSGSYDGSISATGLTLNVYYDFLSGQRVTPYIGGGIGAYGVKLDDGVIDDDGEGFQWTVMGGVDVTLTDRIDLTLEARFQNLGYDYGIEGAPDEDTKTVNIDGAGFRGGLRHKF